MADERVILNYDKNINKLKVENANITDVMVQFVNVLVN